MIEVIHVLQEMDFSKREVKKRCSGFEPMI